jgi:Protein of unknown function (DUF3108)
MQRYRKTGRAKRSRAEALLAAGLLVVLGMTPRLHEPRNRTSNVRESTFQEPASLKDGRKSTAKNSSLAAAVPFCSGEILNYRLIWSVFSNAAAVQLSVVERRDLFGTPTWHFRASAHTQVPLRSLAEIDDQFDSYAETATLESRQFEMYLDELGEKENTVSQLVSTRPVIRGRGSVVLVKPQTRDPLAALYALRAIDWQRQSEFRAPVYDGEELYEMRARVELASDAIAVAGQDMKATKISVQLFQGSYQSRTRCFIWFSQDAARIPIVIQAQVPYGSVRAELVSQR